MSMKVSVAAVTPPRISIADLFGHPDGEVWKLASAPANSRPWYYVTLAGSVFRVEKMGDDDRYEVTGVPLRRDNSSVTPADVTITITCTFGG